MALIKQAMNPRSPQTRGSSAVFQVSILILTAERGSGVWVPQGALVSSPEAAAGALCMVKHRPWFVGFCLANLATDRV